MKKPVSILTFLFFIFHQNPCICQAGNLFNAPYKYINPRYEQYTGDKKFNFSAIRVIDARPDTSKIGLYGQVYNFDEVGYIRRLNYKNGLSEDVSNFLFHYYNKAFAPQGDTVVMVIRKAWISQYDTTMLIADKFISSGRIFFTRLKMEMYLKDKEGFYPITRVDTSYMTLPKQSVKQYGYEITDAIITFCDKLFQLDLSTIRKRKKYTLSQINEFNGRAFDKPILNAVNYKKGVYLNFSEFLDNSPSIDYVGINQTKYGDVLYLNDGSGKQYASNNFWGYCDGKDLYVVSGKNFFKLVKIQNTFEYYGIKNLRERFDYWDNYLHKLRPALNMFIYQLDMETGESY